MIEMGGLVQGLDNWTFAKSFRSQELGVRRSFKPLSGAQLIKHLK
jgi:hypothetical protein